MTRRWGPLENLTLSDHEINRSRPDGGTRHTRIFCPFHGGVRQRSLSINNETGAFKCFRCGAWGFTAAAREERRAGGGSQGVGRERLCRPEPRFQCAPEPHPARDDLDQLLNTFQRNLRHGSLGAQYLEKRAIPLDLARQLGIGFAPYGSWPHKARDVRPGRLVFPHTTPAGRVVNLYGRAIDLFAPGTKDKRHDHLVGAKGCFNAPALASGVGPLYVCEGPLNALSLVARGLGRTIAIFGVNGWRPKWAHEVKKVVFAFDDDDAGRKSWRKLVADGWLAGKRIGHLAPEAYGGHNDANAALVAGALDLDPESCLAWFDIGDPTGYDLPRSTRRWPPRWRREFDESTSWLQFDGGRTRETAVWEAEKGVREDYRKQWDGIDDRRRDISLRGRVQLTDAEVAARLADDVESEDLGLQLEISSAVGSAEEVGAEGYD